MKQLADPDEALMALGLDYQAARQAAESKRQALKRAVRSHLAAGIPELRVAQLAGVDRMTVRKWRRQDG